MRNFTQSVHLPSLICLLSILISGAVVAQKPKQANGAEIKLALKKLNVLCNVLYVAAHPDDENTRLIAYLANERLVNTGYLSLTRGDGGQNLVGPEIREQLGMIRTQELLQARRIDGGQQFFSRANDFGYSKSFEETFEIWGKDEIMSDAVWTIRNFRPDVIITRFPPDKRAGHGHHTASAMIAIEAFDLAADPQAFSDQLKHVEVWQPERLFINTGRWWNKNITKDTEGVVTVDVGKYNPLLGKSYTEVAAASRSMHKSQGFGSTGSRGGSLEFLEIVKGSQPENDLFENIDFSWSRVEKGQAYEQMVNNLIKNFDPENPAQSVPALANLYNSLEDLSDDFWRIKKQQEVKKLIKDCLGLYLEIRADDYYATPGSNVKLDIEMITRAKTKVQVQNFKMVGTDDLVIINKPLVDNTRLNHSLDINIPEDFPLTVPYWLKDEGSYGLFNVGDQKLIGMPENKPTLRAIFKLKVDKEAFDFEVPVVYKWNDPVAGESYRPFIIVPPVSVNASEGVMIFADDKAKAVSLTVTASADSVEGHLKLDLPAGWKASPESYALEPMKKGGEAIFDFKIFPSQAQSVGNLSAYVDYNGKRYGQSVKSINYDHIPVQTLLPESTVKLVKLNITRYGEKIGYIDGAGDDIPNSLEQIGYEVDVLSDDDISVPNLQKYDAVILGVRALNTNKRMKYYQDKLLSYVSGGGNLIVQYNTSFRLVTQDFAPYKLKISRDRVAEEDAKVKFLNPGHEVLNTPNKITLEDFDNWVQERGLYFPNEWSSEYDQILSWHDKGEDPKNGSLLIAKYGQGYYTYCAISFFRQLPAGVPGAYRLFTNIISLGKSPEKVK
ncbi:PIG-L family deacetylase [Fulvivirgaceae bacterium BMA12]|uniref:PIG-L family deacetylase n=1 Tax=Agaribacillus aureus TaxID=3051825 RepID=A0ABT8LLQ9_9BACT|nr:PIG-L family deacetylase [Fulvivirgaceae bacterium BMA12]